MTKQVKELS